MKIYTGSKESLTPLTIDCIPPKIALGLLCQPLHPHPFPPIRPPLNISADYKCRCAEEWRNEEAQEAVSDGGAGRQAFGSPRLIVENKCVRADDCCLCMCVYVCVREGLFQGADISTSGLLTANRRAVVDESKEKKNSVREAEYDICHCWDPPTAT